MNEIKRVLIHIRWPLQSLTLLGFLFGIVVTRVAFSMELVFGFTSWFLLCAGITVFNSYYDKDGKPVAGLEKPPPTTTIMLAGAWLLKLSGFLISLFLNKTFLAMYGVGVVLSVVYSHKKIRLKSNGYRAVFVNFCIGAITFLAASSFSVPSQEILFYGSIAAGFFLSAMYLMMQVHQKEEDATREDISIMILHGRQATIIAAIITLIGAALFSLLSFAESGYHWVYYLILAIYFIIIIFLNCIWLKKKEDAIADFKIMNTLTLRASYVANVILAVIYILETVRLNM